MPYFNYNGRKVYFINKGQGDPLILLPGNTSSSSAHRYDIEFFSKYYRVICPDYLGYGKTERLKRVQLDFWWSNAEMCKELLKSLDIKDCILVGTSGGGIIAINIAIISPELVKCVVADSITGEYPNKNDFDKQVEARKMATDEMKLFWQICHGEDWQEVVELDSQLLKHVSKENESFYKKRLNEITCPVLLTGSLSDDAITNIEINICNVSRQITNSKIMLFPTGFHPLMWSRPEDFRESVMDFFKKI
ncbi:alpha/beta fold hydrolase [Maledivibacter halophilus]|uniref:Pimeloyl-ACP methyl ester carboxylesterase n=1 Tax=Maledivibacter halophilus TaxID=36842 RepID=A0A1T5MM60_9FIRM|nr:alpha/beta hydrolase [Maledivibacter halophilus]SKC89305.1 Pimeloyl-ACP methyl ester carboxylesterase [Maledivibacter halophilus]